MKKKCRHARHNSTVYALPQNQSRIMVNGLECSWDEILPRFYSVESTGIVPRLRGIYNNSSLARTNSLLFPCGPSTLTTTQQRYIENVSISRKHWVRAADDLKQFHMLLGFTKLKLYFSQNITKISNVLPFSCEYIVDIFSEGCWLLLQVLLILSIEHSVLAIWLSKICKRNVDSFSTCWKKLEILRNGQTLHVHFYKD